MIFNIQRFCVNDGPGIRTSVFFKGCPLRCQWCHNPESQSFEKELMFDSEKCVSCGMCATLCPNGCHVFSEGNHVFHREKCAACGKCCETYCGCLEIAGKEMTADEIIAVVLRDKPFYEQSGGGMTLTGGEPMSSYPMVMELLKKAREKGISSCIETCGFCPTENLLSAAELTGIFLFDFKETDPGRHQAFTGVSNDLIVKNLYALDSTDAKIILRCPIIPGFNDRTEHFSGIADLANRLKNISEINIEPYHPLGVKKNKKLDRISETESLPFPSDEDVVKWIREIQSKTDVPVKRA